MPRTVALITGSLREGSLNRKLAHQIETLANGKLVMEHIAIGDLPLYNDDLWADPPAPVTRFKQQMEKVDAVLVISPEYNRTYPGIIANAFDWGSRPIVDSSWRGKPAAIGGATKGAVGTAAGQQHLRLAMVSLAMVVMHTPELYVTWNDERFAEDGTIRSDATRKLLQGFVDAFAAWIEKHGRDDRAG